MKWVKEHHPNPNPHRHGYNNWRSEDGRFFIRQSTGGNRWIIETTDNTAPFTGYRGRRTHVTSADTINFAKRICEMVADDKTQLEGCNAEV